MGCDLHGRDLHGLRSAWAAICMGCDLHGLRSAWAAICMGCDLHGLRSAWVAICMVAICMGCDLHGLRSAGIAFAWDRVLHRVPLQGAVPERRYVVVSGAAEGCVG